MNYLEVFLFLAMIIPASSPCLAQVAPGTTKVASAPVARSNERYEAKDLKKVVALKKQVVAANAELKQLSKSASNTLTSTEGSKSVDCFYANPSTFVCLCKGAASCSDLKAACEGLGSSTGTAESGACRFPF